MVSDNQRKLWEKMNFIEKEYEKVLASCDENEIKKYLAELLAYKELVSFLSGFLINKLGEEKLLSFEEVNQEAIKFFKIVLEDLQNKSKGK